MANVSRGPLLTFLGLASLLVAIGVSSQWPEAWRLLSILLGNDPVVLEAPSFVPSESTGVGRARLSGQLDVGEYLNRTNANWTFLGRSDGVDTFARKVRNSKLLTFRGVTVLDLHISDIMGPFVNVSQSLDWVAMLQHVERFPLVEPLTGQEDLLVDHIYQVLRLPWPITQRDILLRREFQFNLDGVSLTATSEGGGARQITISYRSVQDDRVPERSNMIRAHSPYTMWRFTMLDEDSSNRTSSSGASLPPQKISSGLTHTLRTSLRRLRSKVKTWFGRVNSFFSAKLRRSHQDPFPVRSNGSMLSASPAQPTTIAGSANEQSTSYFSEKNGFCKVNSTEPVLRRRGRTIVEVETNVDSKGSIPIWFVNYMQR